jgi:hypothetical protein
MKLLGGRGGDEVEAALERLDRVTDDEAQATATQTLEVICHVCTISNWISETI